jgi:2-polyprenyl-3-methyl-5-hydroxy-6-metoxy-1,4-benzoquinol methylase
MKQNIFDDEQFFAAYSKYRESAKCLNSTLEQPALRSLLPNLGGTHVLDVGCGTGGFCKYALEQGAEFVLGLDISRRMSSRAESDLGRNPSVRIVNQAIEDFNWQGEPFDIIASSLTLHYVEPLEDVLRKLTSWLHDNGTLLMSVNHPFYTASLGANSTTKSPEGCVIRNYWNEGTRRHSWFVEGVIKYHRTLQTYTQIINSAGLYLTGLYEPSPQSTGATEWEGDPELAERPIFILFKAEKSVC